MALSKIDTAAIAADAVDNTILDLASDFAGIHLGGTAAANALDDYEEGTWTPENYDNFGTFSAQDGSYTKIGNLVYIAGRFDFTGANTSATRKISGLPFTPIDEFSGTSVDAGGLYWGDTRHFVYIVSDGTIVLTSNGNIAGSPASSSVGRVFATYRTSS